tara:strand:+ start:2128 stop:2979 length:852 start_codon:yes stop_codon:yes gene_type:complete
MENKHCYYFKYIKQENGIFENIVDAVFILLMENSPREQNVFKQLYEYKLHSNVIIQYNKGYKLCKKKLFKNQSNYDLLDANIQVFNYSQNKNYENILVLEDDFIITKNIYKKEYIEAISNFVKNKDYNVLSLGNTGWIKKKKYNKYILECFIYGCAQANMYNKQYFKLLKKHLDLNKIKHVDEFSNIKKLYMMDIPIIIQAFPETDNIKTWYLFPKVLFNIMNKILNIDWNEDYKGKELEYWDRYYCFVNMFHIILYLIIIMILSYIIVVKSKFFKVSTKKVL